MTSVDSNLTSASNFGALKLSVLLNKRKQRITKLSSVTFKDNLKTFKDNLKPFKDDLKTFESATSHEIKQHF